MRGMWARLVVCVDFLPEIWHTVVADFVDRLKIFWRMWFAGNSSSRILKNVRPTLVERGIIPDGVAGTILSVILRAC